MLIKNVIVLNLRTGKHNLIYFTYLNSELFTDEGERLLALIKTINSLVQNIAAMSPNNSHNTALKEFYFASYTMNFLNNW